MPIIPLSSTPNCGRQPETLNRPSGRFAPERHIQFLWIHRLLRPLRILHTEPSLDLGGQEFRVLREAIGMKHRGHDVILGVQQGSQLAACAMKEELCFEFIKVAKTRLIPLAFDLAKLISRYHFDVVNTHGSIDSWTASVAARLSKTKPLIVRTRHKSVPVSPTLRHRLLYNILPHLIVTTGEAVRKQLIQDNGIDASKIVSIPTGVDVDLYKPSEPDWQCKNSLGFSREDIVIGTVAFLRDYKGIGDLLQTAPSLLKHSPYYKFLIVGDGPERSSLVSAVSRLGLESHVVFTGFRDDVPRLLALMDVVVLPSIGAEGVPQVLTQALAMGKPVVATSVGGIPEIIHDGETGLLVPPNDPQRLGEAIGNLAQDSILRKTLGERGREDVVTHYSLETMLDRTEEMYERFTSTSSR